MTLIRTPVLNTRQIHALRSLLRFDHAKSMRFRVSGPGNDLDKTNALLALADSVSLLDAPLLVAQFLIKAQGLESIAVPLETQYHDIYIRLLKIDIGPTSFPGLTAEDIERAVGPIRPFIEEVKYIFENAPYTDNVRAQAVGKVGPPPSGLAN